MMNRLVRIALCVGLSGCASHAYVSKSPAEQIRVVDMRADTVSRIGGATGQAVVGLAADPVNGALYARMAPAGTRVLEIDKATGAIRRDFIARGVVPGCAAQALATDAVVCGLAIRLFDHHLFLDHPQGSMVHEVDRDGQWVRNIPLRSPRGAIGGLAYDQRQRVLYLLFVATQEVAEVDLTGVERRRFRLDRLVQPEGLSIGVNGDELYVPLAGGNVLGVFDMSGRFIRQHALGGAQGIAGGVAADSVRTRRLGP